MLFKNLIKSGWLHALFIGVIAYPLGALSAKVVTSVFNSHALVYTATMILSISAALLLRSGPGNLAIKTLKRPETWIYAIVQIIVVLCGILLMKYVSATEGAGLFRTTGLFTLILSGLFLAQKINKYEGLGALLILVGFCLIIHYADIPLEAKILLVIFTLTRALSQSIQKIITEVHKTNRESKNSKDENRVAGFIMAILGLGMFLILLIISHIKSKYNIELFYTFPNYTDFFDIKCFYLALFMGITVESMAKYCEFYAGKTIGAKYLITIISLQIIFVYIIEKILAFFGLMDPVVFQTKDFTALGLILLGNVVIALAGFVKDVKFIKKGEKQDTLQNMDYRFIDSEDDFNIVKVNLSSILALYNQDITKVIEELDINKMKLENILNYDFEDVKLEITIAKKINNFASMNVSLKDKLTKAFNRYYLEQKAEELFANNTPFNLYYLDLNKFKPVNDIYSHEAGDDLLVKVVKRLNGIVDKSDFVVRIGGDEFVVIQLNELDKNLSSDILKTIEDPFTNIKDAGQNEINISTAIGLCSSTNFDNLETMLQTADDKMYEDKAKR